MYCLTLIIFHDQFINSDQKSIKQQQRHQQINMARGIREPIFEHHNRYTALIFATLLYQMIFFYAVILCVTLIASSFFHPVIDDGWRDCVCRGKASQLPTKPNSVLLYTCVLVNAIAVIKFLKCKKSLPFVYYTLCCSATYEIFCACVCHVQTV